MVKASTLIPLRTQARSFELSKRNIMPNFVLLRYLSRFSLSWTRRKLASQQLTVGQLMLDLAIIMYAPTVSF